MSEVLKTYDLQKFRSLISIESGNSLQYLWDECESTDKVVLKVSFTCRCLQNLYDIKYTYATLKTSYINILNDLLAEQWGLKVKDDCSRLEGRLRRLCAETHAKFKGLTGDAHRKFSSTVRKIDIRHGELVSISEVEEKLFDLNEENESLKEENIRLQDRCDGLYNELVKAEALEKETREQLEVAHVDLENLKIKNYYLHEYLERIEEQQSFVNTGKKITEVKERQQRRKLRELKTNIEKSLWFARTLGLNLDSAWFRDENGENYKIDYNVSEDQPKSYKDLSEEEQEKIKSVLFLTDKFCVSDAAYHELTMVTGGEKLPRSYLIKQCKDNLNQLCHITRTPGEADGAQLIFEEELKSRIKSQLVNNIFQANNFVFKINNFNNQ